MEAVEQQERNALQRQRMLNFWMGARGSKVSLTCFGAVLVVGVLEASDSGQETFHLSELHTPIGKYPNVLVRSTDILAMDFQSEALREEEREKAGEGLWD